MTMSLALIAYGIARRRHFGDVDETLPIYVWLIIQISLYWSFQGFFWSTNIKDEKINALLNVQIDSIMTVYTFRNSMAVVYACD